MTITRAYHSERPMVIQEMPVTKRIQAVTIGDLGRGPACGTSQPQASLRILEHPAGNLAGYPIDEFWSNSSQFFPTTPGKVRWTFQPRTLKKGAAYSFELYRTGGCAQATMTSWKHNWTFVHPGPSNCAATPLMVREDGSDPGIYGKRMYHVEGSNDSHGACVNTTTGFDPFMPGGWLLTAGVNGNWNVVMNPHYSQYPVEHCGNNSKYKDAGLEEMFWRYMPNTTTKEYVCRWTQFGAPGPWNMTSDGWYYSQPWITGPTAQGAPRTMDLELETIDYGTLLQRHAPRLIYDPQDSYSADSARVMADAPDTSLHEYPAIINGDYDGLDYLDVPYPNGDVVDYSDHYLDAETSDYLGSYDSYAGQHPGLYNRTYGRVVQRDDGEVILQYWLFYYYQDGVTAASWGEHEGDWEMVQVHLNSANAPFRAAYAQHNGGTRCKWSGVGHGWSPNTPDVYVARSTHASYFAPGRQTNVYDNADGDPSTGSIPYVEEITSKVPWVKWPGSWGGSGSGGEGGSPAGPSHQGSGKWADPKQWSDALSIDSLGQPVAPVCA